MQRAAHVKPLHLTAEPSMAEEENIVGELHGHFDQALRTALSGGLQITEQRARRRQNEAEAERLMRSKRPVNSKSANGPKSRPMRCSSNNALPLEEAERAERTRRTADAAAERAVETPGETAAEDCTDGLSHPDRRGPGPLASEHSRT